MDVFHQSKQLHRNLEIPWRKALRLQFSSGWNAVGLLMVINFLMYHVLWLDGYLGLTDEEMKLLRAGESPENGPLYKVLLSYFFNCLGFLFAFIYQLSFTSVNPFMGPLQYALVEMVKGVLKFTIFFLTLYFGFTFSVTKLFLQYEQSRYKFGGSNETATTPRPGDKR